MPKMNAPMTSETDTGATEPAAASPSEGAERKTSAQSPISRKCAARPVASPATRKRRHAEAKPYWKPRKTAPSAPPRANSATPRAPVSSTTRTARTSTAVAISTTGPRSGDAGCPARFVACTVMSKSLNETGTGCAGATGADMDQPRIPFRKFLTLSMFDSPTSSGLSPSAVHSTIEPS